MIRLSSICALAAILSLGTGCAAAVAGAAGVGAVKWASNTSQRAYPADAETTWTAALASLRDAGYAVDPATPYSNGALAIGDVKLNVKTASDGVTHVLVRVGTFDNNRNREQARRILDGISAHLAPSS